MSNITKIPFTEQYEQLKMELIRDNAANVQSTNAYMSRINTAYCYTIPIMQDWKFLMVEGTITFEPCYDTGTITLTNGSATITGSGTTWTSDYEGWYVIAGNHRFTISSVDSTTQITATYTHIGDTTSSLSYKLVKPAYDLASDFQFPIQDPSSFIYYYSSSGSRVYLDSLSETENNEDINLYNSGSNPGNYQIDFSSNKIEVWPTISSSSEKKRLFYDYTPLLTPMKDETDGSVSVTNGSTTVTGTTTSFENMSAGDYFRLDADGVASKSKWYEISSITSDTSLELTSAYPGATRSSQSFAISEIPEYYPPAMHIGIIYKAAIDAAAAKESSNMTYWLSVFTQLQAQYLFQERKSYTDTRMKTAFRRKNLGR